MSFQFVDSTLSYKVYIFKQYAFLSINTISRERLFLIIFEHKSEFAIKIGRSFFVLMVTKVMKNCVCFSEEYDLCSSFLQLYLLFCCFRIVCSRPT